ncbi:alpha-L-fucosidase [Bryocella elongata]|uniref:alpha-L-fucosidase n=1 Tax=Bryocella elongata TaxID=863522 RepID=A0A1H6AYH7_9BACT|nr:alpha-L-fucosidase [Bryocella elongata]SEG52836.1 alpha-L-fucosidase [Bryocella elongata]
MKLAALLILSLLTKPAIAQDKKVAPGEVYERNIARQTAKVHAETSVANKKVPFHAAWDSLATYQTPNWFRDAKFGIFLHWGVYSVPAFGNEWYSRNMYIEGNPAHDHQVKTYGPLSSFGYKDFIPMFKAEHFDAGEWIDLFSAAGARYVVPVAEHCDGFAMYASQMTPYNVAQMGPKRDTTGELAAAARARGMHLGLSMHTAEHWWWYGVGNAVDSDVRSRTPQTELLYGPAAAMKFPVAGKPLDWTHEPNASHLELWVPPDQRFLDQWLAQSTEVVDRYHPELIYFDWWIGQPAMKPALQQFAAYYYDRSAASGVKPVLTYKEEAMPANTATLDIERGKLDTLRLLPWQTDTSVSVHSWGYVENDEYRTAGSLIQQLIDTVAKNGNLLLNVGPKADGTIPGEAKSVLREMGGWLRVNGEAIYATRPFAVFGEGPTVAAKNSQEKNHDIQTYTSSNVRYTQSKDGRLIYALFMGWPADGDATMHVLFRGNPYLDGSVCRVELIGSSDPVAFHQDEFGLHVTLSRAADPKLPEIPAYALRLHTHC